MYYSNIDWNWNVSCTTRITSCIRCTFTIKIVYIFSQLLAVLLNASNKASADYKVICYFTDWAWYRSGAGKFSPSNIDPSLCTHIIYAFASLNESSLTIQPYDTWADIDNNLYEQVTAFQNQGVKVSIALGGWSDSTSKYR